MPSKISRARIGDAELRKSRSVMWRFVMRSCSAVGDHRHLEGQRGAHLAELRELPQKSLVGTRERYSISFLARNAISVALS